jgi:hypothetical protein
MMGFALSTLLKGPNAQSGKAFLFTGLFVFEQPKSVTLISIIVHKKRYILLAAPVISLIMIFSIITTID